MPLRPCGQPTPSTAATRARRMTPRLLQKFVHCRPALLMGR
jgi:hypothetical protein